jgi:hypothetical protein
MEVGAKAELVGNDFTGEIAFADEERRNEHPRREKIRQNFFDLRFLFPERLADFGKNPPTTQFRRVLMDGRGGTGVLLRAVTQHHERGIGELIVIHATGLAQERTLRKRAVAKNVFFIETFFPFEHLKFKLSGK